MPCSRKKLKDYRNLSEPYRHEWVSLRMFQSFVREDMDEQWLNRLTTVSGGDEEALLQHLRTVQDRPDSYRAQPFACMPRLAQAVGWLILTHHKLPHSGDGETKMDFQLSPQIAVTELEFVTKECHEKGITPSLALPGRHPVPKRHVVLKSATDSATAA